VAIRDNYKRTDSPNKAIGMERTKIDLQSVRRSDKRPAMKCRSGPNETKPLAPEEEEDDALPE
jgi:hypothetical protein